MMGDFCVIADKREVDLVTQSVDYARDTELPYLFATPAHGAPRYKLSDLVSAKRAARVKGNQSPEYQDGANVRFWKRVNDTRQRFPRDLRTHQSPCRPFESGGNVLPGMERWAKENRVQR